MDEIFKYTIGPVLAIIGVGVGSLLNARLTRKQKIRDELFSYKVKAHVKIAEAVQMTRKDFGYAILVLDGEPLMPFDQSDYKGHILIASYFQQIHHENILFLDKATRQASKLFGDTIIGTSIAYDRYEKNKNDKNRLQILTQIGYIEVRGQALFDLLYKKIGLNKL
ncbi:hypothetical protein [Chryseobacterium potabilaquae]|uniref:Uncharacterized protein n=1 Tax=Chryseobacterium potabilaquae TaxID=2675057 RepID=A0A6N4XD04_9FLAO|nr:hypothetical protein [Chryseobacterium potabilaquae]CAA7197619.1 hypothetical protein CHRY9293_03692 [Chryseobacterium potabilaquae]